MDVGWIDRIYNNSGGRKNMHGIGILFVPDWNLASQGKRTEDNSILQMN
jgi:hypothetical protein